MANVTYYVALPILAGEDGELIAGRTGRGTQRLAGEEPCRAAWRSTMQAPWPSREPEIRPRANLSLP